MKDVLSQTAQQVAGAPGVVRYTGTNFPLPAGGAAAAAVAPGPVYTPGLGVGLPGFKSLRGKMSGAGLKEK